MGCKSCGHRMPNLPTGQRGVIGQWALKWPNGSLQPFPTEERARAYQDKHPQVQFELVPPPEPEEN